MLELASWRKLVGSPPAAGALDDLAFWNSIKGSNSREELEAYLKQHPERALG
jgi:hypothetical protein